ncbi:reverse transcriptase [Senna tora]|uniref:Reverse transcriptase n=1 Tax=Senna tora TaxID=362788 RepID=A0A835CIP1_9FABA|nr:reverse transcriptase [Senna tora]
MDGKEEEFTKVKVRVQLWGVPLHCRTEKVASKLCAKVGEVHELGLYEEQSTGNVFMRGVVNIDVRKGLRKGVNLGNARDGVYWVDFLYEKIPRCCFSCGVFGHDESDCLTKKMVEEKGEVFVSKEVGAWMRADRSGRKVTWLRTMRETQVMVMEKGKGETTVLERVGEKMIIDETVEGGKGQEGKMKNDEGGVKERMIKISVPKEGGEELNVLDDGDGRKGVMGHVNLTENHVNGSEGGGGKCEVGKGMKSIKGAVLLDSDYTSKRSYEQKKKIFRFKKMWTMHSDCGELIREAWVEKGGAGGKELRGNLEEVKELLSRWNKEVFGNVNNRIWKLQEELQNLYNVPVGGFDKEQVGQVEKELKGTLEHEEIMWRQRSRVSWLKEGDRNTKFFHNSASKRRRKNTIKRLTDRAGEWKEELDDMREIAVEYFKEIFTSSKPENYDDVIVHVLRKISDYLMHSLDENFTMEEVKEACFMMYPTKAPGPDGFLALFYQKYWEVVGTDVCRMALLYLNRGIFPEGINHTRIVLIPKTTDPVDLTHFRPISLCNVIYKMERMVKIMRMSCCVFQVSGLFMS